MDEESWSERGGGVVDEQSWRGGHGGCIAKDSGVIIEEVTTLAKASLGNTYIYIYRKRERDIHVYIYVYTYICIYIYLYYMHDYINMCINKTIYRYIDINCLHAYVYLYVNIGMHAADSTYNSFRLARVMPKEPQFHGRYVCPRERRTMCLF